MEVSVLAISITCNWKGTSALFRSQEKSSCRMMLRGMAEPITIHKSRSCPADFSTEDIAQAAAGASQPRTPPVSNGSNRRKKASSSSKELNGNGSVTMNVTMTSPRSGNGMAYVPKMKAVPGRPRRRGNANTASLPRRRKNKQSFRYRLMNARWMKNPMQTSSPMASLFVAVILWYTLGVVSITTSNLLMMEPRDYVGGVPPLFLTLQQLIIGTTLLRFLLSIRFLRSAGVQPWPSPSAAAKAAQQSRRKNLLFNNLHSTGKNSLWR